MQGQTQQVLRRLIDFLVSLATNLVFKKGKQERIETWKWEGRKPGTLARNDHGPVAQLVRAHA
jgi:hypothetical protein